MPTVTVTATSSKSRTIITVGNIGKITNIEGLNTLTHVDIPWNEETAGMLMDKIRNSLAHLNVDVSDLKNTNLTHAHLFPLYSNIELFAKQLYESFKTNYFDLSIFYKICLPLYGIENKGTVKFVLPSDNYLETQGFVFIQATSAKAESEKTHDDDEEKKDDLSLSPEKEKKVKTPEEIAKDIIRDDNIKKQNLELTEKFLQEVIRLKNKFKSRSELESLFSIVNKIVVRFYTTTMPETTDVNTFKREFKQLKGIDIELVKLFASLIPSFKFEEKQVLTEADIKGKRADIDINIAKSVILQILNAVQKYGDNYTYTYAEHIKILNNFIAKTANKLIIPLIPVIQRHLEKEPNLIIDEDFINKLLEQQSLIDLHNEVINKTPQISFSSYAIPGTDDISNIYNNILKIIEGDKKIDPSHLSKVVQVFNSIQNPTSGLHKLINKCFNINLSDYATSKTIEELPKTVILLLEFAGQFVATRDIKKSY